MQKEQFEIQWPQIKSNIREQWSSLSEDEVRQINGRYDLLISKLQQKYGLTKDEAETEIERYVDRIKSYGIGKFNTSQFRESETYKTSEAARNSFFKGLLAAGIPLLLLSGYLAYENSKYQQESYTSTTQESTITGETTADRILSQNITRAFSANQNLAADANAIKVSSTNGVVTVTGTVSSNQNRALITRIAENYPGVTQVNNFVDVR